MLITLLIACAANRHPIVIQIRAANSPASRRRAPQIPVRPDNTPLPHRPYVRPTDRALPLDQPILRIGDEVITLAVPAARVERYAALDNARRLIERVGLEKLNFATPGENPTADSVAAIQHACERQRLGGRSTTS
jgi:hypothetical protein